MLLKDAIRSSSTIVEILEKMKWPDNTTYRRKLKKECLEQDLVIDIKRLKFPFITKVCPACHELFTTQEGHKDEKTVCSRSCANTYFRSGKNHPNYKEDIANYRVLAFRHLELVCSSCSYSKVPEILQVHHKDRDVKNNVISNLEILCPNCHQEEHFAHKDGSFG